MLTKFWNIAVSHLGSIGFFFTLVNSFEGVLGSDYFQLLSSLVIDFGIFIFGDFAERGKRLVRFFFHIVDVAIQLKKT